MKEVGKQHLIIEIRELERLENSKKEKKKGKGRGKGKKRKG